MIIMIKKIVSFIWDVHRDVKEMMINNPGIPKDTRVIILRVWSDGFEAHNVKGSIKFNSRQVFTVKLMGPKDQTLPYSLCFKTFNVRQIWVNLLEELLELQKVWPRYWGKDKQIFTTTALLEFVSNDYPERCFNTGLSQNGIYMKWSGYSCLYDRARIHHVCIASFKRWRLFGIPMHSRQHTLNKL